jgi:uncharacterized protein YdaU (DUF1376 family)
MSKPRTDVGGTAASRSPVLRTVRRHYGDGIVRTMLAMECDQCSRQDDKVVKPNLPEVAISRFFRSAGWEVDNKCQRAVCPKCQEKAKVTDISAAALKRQRQMFVLLDEHFDVDDGAFEQGWSDARVAKETGLAENVVIQAREAAYGPIKVNPAFVSAGREVAELKTKLAKDLADIQGLLDQTKRDFEERLAQIEAKVSRALRGAA